MSSRLRLLHAWMAQVDALLPAVRVTRVRVLALLTLGMIWAETVRLHRVAAALPVGVRVPRSERRLRRFLANPAVSVETLWHPLLPHLLGRWRGRRWCWSSIRRPIAASGRCCGSASSSTAGCCR